MSPYEMYLQQVKGCFDLIRADNDGMTYYPPQFGGLFGQLSVLQQDVVLEIIDFDIPPDDQ